MRRWRCCCTPQPPPVRAPAKDPENAPAEQGRPLWSCGPAAGSPRQNSPPPPTASPERQGPVRERRAHQRTWQQNNARRHFGSGRRIQRARGPPHCPMPQGSGASPSSSSRGLSFQGVEGVPPVLRPRPPRLSAPNGPQPPAAPGHVQPSRRPRGMRAEGGRTLQCDERCTRTPQTPPPPPPMDAKGDGQRTRVAPPTGERWACMGLHRPALAGQPALALQTVAAALGGCGSTFSALFFVGKRLRHGGLLRAPPT